MEVTEANLAEVADWCGGELDDETTPSCVLVPTFHGQEPAFPGEIVVGGKFDYYPIKPEVYAQAYETVKAAT